MRLLKATGERSLYKVEVEKREREGGGSNFPINVRGHWRQTWPGRTIRRLLHDRQTIYHSMI